MPLPTCWWTSLKTKTNLVFKSFKTLCLPTHHLLLETSLGSARILMNAETAIHSIIACFCASAEQEAKHFLLPASKVLAQLVRAIES